MPIIGSLAGASAKGLGGLGASVVPAVPTTLTTDYLVVAGGVAVVDALLTVTAVVVAVQADYAQRLRLQVVAEV
jgi:hypothetical protein